MKNDDATNTLHSVHDIIRSRLLALTPSLAPMAGNLALASGYDLTVLLTGETGTGKTFLARLIHECSPRKTEPFLTVTCGAQPTNLLESIFFGHLKGAFTGADRDKEGKFKAAGNGTILLDDIDTLNLQTQAILLRVIETGEYEPVGSNETLHVNARIIAASNWDLNVAAEQGRFRQDLYYRLSILSFNLPPLRERIEDIRPLVHCMVTRFSTKFKKPIRDLSPDAMGALENFPWPGNIRQLENVMQRAVLLCSGHELTLESLPMNIRDHLAPKERSGEVTQAPLMNRKENAERYVIQRTLHNHRFNRSRTADALGISRVTLYKKMRKYDISPSVLNRIRAQITKRDKAFLR
jgi:transcriptional regulator with PAS, ATPase and Fis domain